jgi:hypothetical protein
MNLDAVGILYRRTLGSALAALIIASTGCGSAAKPAPPRSEMQASKPATGRVSLNHGSKADIEPQHRAAGSAKPAAPPYDLPSDIEARRSEALSDLGERTATEVVEGVFLVVAPGGRGALAGSIDVTRRSLAAYFNGRFSRRPERAISVYLFPEERSYGRYCTKRWGEPCSSPYGFYLHAERRIVMNVGLGVGTLTHELVHPLVESDFPQAPDWINEGIASLFEQFYLPQPGEIRGGKNWRHPRLIRGLRSKTERAQASLPSLFGMSDEVFRGELEDLNYSTARYFCQWLDSKDQLWPFYQRWRDNHATDPTGEKAFFAVTGKTPAEADAEWARWVQSL